jgi:hypothetical protein
MAFFDCAGIRLMLAIPERLDLDHPSSILYSKSGHREHAQGFGVARCAFRDQTDAGRADATHDLWLAEFRDSENNVLALMCEKPKAVKS